MSRKRITLILLVLATLSAGTYGATIRDSEIIKRLEANRSLYKQWDAQPSLRELVGKTHQNLSRNPVVYETPLMASGVPQVKMDPNNHPRIKYAATHSDLIVIGTVIRTTSAFTEKAGFIFTDSELLIERVIAQSAEDKLRDDLGAGGEVTVTSPGGIMFVEGYRVSAFLPIALPLKNNGHYILFLKYLPESNSYKRVDLEGFDISEPAPKVLRKGIPNPLPGLVSAEMLNAIQSSVSDTRLNSRLTR